MAEVDYMTRVLEELRGVLWAEPLVREIANRGGIIRDNKPLLFEARVAHALHRKGITAQYEFAAGVGDSTVDFGFWTAPEFLVEVVSIGRSAAAERATFHNDDRFGTFLVSPQAHQSSEEREQSEEGEGLLAIQKIGEKVYSGRAPVKFPPVQANRYHVVVADMRGHLGGNDKYDWRQIAYGAESVPPGYRKHWLDKDNRLIPVLGVWSEGNPMRFAATARERLHAIMFVAEKNYDDASLCQGSLIVGNPHLFASEDEMRRVMDLFPLGKRPTG